MVSPVRPRVARLEGGPESAVVVLFCMKISPYVGVDADGPYLQNVSGKLHDGFGPTIIVWRAGRAR